MERRLVKQSELIEIAEHLRRQCVYYVSGSYSISVPSTKTKYLNEIMVKEWPDIEGNLRDMLPGEAARTELKREWPLLKKVGWSGPMIKLFDMRPPMHYTGPSLGEYTLIDLKSAYWQIYRLMWLDTPYPMGYYGKLPLYQVAERLKLWKPARNAVMGICRSRTTVGVKGDKRYYLHTTNEYLSPGLWATVQETLHYVARLAISYGAIYVNTDGYIFPEVDSDRVDHFTEALTELGLSFEIKARGAGQIKCWNSYQVGQKSTKPYRLGLTHKTGGFTNVRKQRYAGWEKYIERLAAIARRGYANQDES